MALAQRARVPLAFDRARDRFLQTLTEDEKKCFSQSTSIDDIYSLAEKLQNEQGSRGSLRNMARIEPFLTSMTQYAKVIEVFIQVKPEIMALIWGPLKLLLQLASQFTESFEKVLDAIGQIGECLPRFRKFAMTFSYSDQMQEVISTVYEDIMNFYRHALQFFNRRAWKITFTLTWSSFETQFGLILRNLQRHQALVDAEACAEDIIQSQKAREEEQKRAKEYQLEDMHRKMKDIRDWLKPVNVTDLREKCERLKQDGTGKWLLENKDMKGWIAGKGKKSIWLTGKPGSGKTILSYTVLEHLEKRVPSTNTPRLVLYFFCSYEQADSIVCQNILCTLIYQIISQKKDLIAYVYPEISKLLSVSMLQRLLYNLIEASVSPSEFVYIIIDGIDELLSREREIIMQTLTELRQNSVAPASRIFVASRDLTNIRSAFEKKKPKVFEIPIKESNRRDIHQYIVSESQRVVEEVIPEGGPEQQLLQKEIENSLSTRADGMFLWAHLVIESLLSQDSIKEIREALIDLPEGLGQVYERIIGRIRRLDEKQKIKANKILEWMSCTYRPLRVEELEDALSIEHYDLTLDKEKRQTIIRLRRLCGPIVEVSNGIVTFAHFTAKEYLQDKRSGPFIDCLNSHLSISLVCITYQCFRCYELGASIDEAVTLLLNGDLRLFDYVHSNWVDHIQEFFRLGPNREQVEILSTSLKELFRKRASSENPYQANDRLNSITDEFPHFEPMLKASFSGVLEFREDLETLKLSLGPGIDLSRWSDMKNPLTLLRGARRLQDILEKYILNGWPPDPLKVEVAYKAYGRNLYFCTYTFCQNSSSRGFSTQTERRVHEERFHAQTYKCLVECCTWADRAFASEASLRTHTSKYHPAPPKKIAAINIEILSELFEEMKYGEQQTQQFVVRTQKLNPTDQQDPIQLSAQSLAAYAGPDSIIPRRVENYQEPYFPQQSVLLPPNLLLPPPLPLEPPSDPNLQQISRLRQACIGGSGGSAMEVKSILKCDKAQEIWNMVNDGQLLAIACLKGQLEVVRVLAEHGEAINQPLKLGSLPLLNAARNGHTDVVKYLLKLGADPQGKPPQYGFDISQEVQEEIQELLDVEARKRLYSAIFRGDTVVVKETLQSDSAEGLLQTLDPLALLKLACSESSLDVVKIFIENGVGTDQPSRNGMLRAAAEHGRTDIFKYLLELGADPRGESLGYRFAQSQARHEIEELLDAAIQRLNGEDIKRLTSAVRDRDTTAVKDILQSDLAKELLKESQDPLNIACVNDHLEMIMILVENGAQINPQAKLGPLKNAVFYGRTLVVKILLDLGADPRKVLEIPIQFRYMFSDGGNVPQIEALLECHALARSS